VVSCAVAAHNHHLVWVRPAQGSRTNCTLVHVNYTSGDLVHVGNVSSACEDFVPTAQGIPRDTLDTRTPGKPAILFASGSGKALHRIDAYSGVDTLVAQLPADYNFTVRCHVCTKLGVPFHTLSQIGVQVVGNSVFYITESQLFRLDGAEWTQIADVAGTAHACAVGGALPCCGQPFARDAPSGYGLAAFQPVCTMNGVLYVAGRQGLVTMSQLNKATATVAVVPYNQTLGRVLDLQCDAAAPGGPRLLALANYELYTIDPQSAQVNELIAIPGASCGLRDDG